MSKVQHIAPFSFCTIVASKALESMHEAATQGGSFRDRHPWRVAQSLFQEAQSQEQSVPILFAVEETQLFDDWALLEDIEVATFSGQKFETRCSFSALLPVNPIFQELSSLTLKPSAEQLHREAVEPIRHYRQQLDLTSIRPYAICETPMFIVEHFKPTQSNNEI